MARFMIATALCWHNDTARQRNCVFIVVDERVRGTRGSGTTHGPPSKRSPAHSLAAGLVRQDRDEEGIL